MAGDERTDLARILVALYKGVLYRDTDEGALDPLFVSSGCGQRPRRRPWSGPGD